MNAQRQSNEATRTDSSSGASAVPSGDAALKMPVGVPRARSGNQLLTTRAADGNCGASPMPSTMRATMNQPKVDTMPPAACANDQTISPMPSSRRGPMRSTSPPTGNWHSA